MFYMDDRRACPHISINLGEEPATLVTSLLISDVTTKDVWRKLTNPYQKENIQTKLNIRKRLYNVGYWDGDIL